MHSQPIDARQMRLLQLGFVLLLLSYAVSALVTGSVSPAAQVRSYQAVQAQVRDTDFTPRPATLTRVWSSKGLFSSEHYGRTATGETVTLRADAGVQAGDRICTVRRHGRLEQATCP